MDHLSLALKSLMIGVSSAILLLAGLLVFLFFQPMGLFFSFIATLSYFASFAYLLIHNSISKE